MTFATEIEKTSSERFTLVRLTFSRYISEDLVSDGPNRYKIEGLNFKVRDAFKTAFASGGLTLDELTNQPNIDDTADDNVWDQQADGTFRIRTTLTINTGELGERIFYLRYYAFLSSSTNGTFFNFDPMAAETDVRLWEPRILREPLLKTNSDDSIFGNIKSTPSNIIVSNEDGWFDQYLGDLDSAHNQECKAWIVSNREVDNFFTASIKSFSISDQVSISLYEATTKLDGQATFGTSRENAFFSEDTDYNIASLTVNRIQSSKKSQPIPLIIGDNSFHETDRESPDDSILGLNATDSQVFNKGQTACGLNPTSTTSGTVNRHHSLARVLGGVRQSGNGFGLPVSLLRGAQFGFDTEIKIAFVTNANWLIGDTFSWAPGGSENDSYGVVIGVTEWTYSSNQYNLVIWCDGDQNLSANGSGGTMSSSAVPFSDDSIGVILRSNAWSNSTSWAGADIGYKPLMRTWDYTVTKNSLDIDSASEYGFQADVDLISITLVDDVETHSVTQMTRSFDPKLDTIEFRMGGSKDFRAHGKIAAQLIQASGLPIDQASFDAADSFFSSNLQFQIPTINSNELLSYRRYLSLITKSLGTYFTTNSDGQITYQFLVPSTSGTVIGDTDIINDRVIRRRIFNDISARLFARNEHIVNSLNTDAAEQTYRSDKFRFLHQSENDVILDHVLTSSAGAERVQKITRNRKDIYDIDVSHRFWDLEIGDTITLTHKQTGDQAKNLTVIGLSKSVDRLTITARDFGELD